METCDRAGQATDYDIAHAHCMLDTYGYRHTLTICNIYCFSRATMAARKRLSVMFIRTLHPQLLIFYFDKTSSVGVIFRKNGLVFLIFILMYLLTAIGLTPGGSSTVHSYTQTVHRTTR